MTIVELVDKLNEYGDDIEVRVEIDEHHTRAVTGVEYSESMASDSKPLVVIR